MTIRLMIFLKWDRSHNSAGFMILVTGATGFIGQHVVRQLMSQGLPLRCLVPEHRRREIAWDPEDAAAPELIIGNVLDEEIVFRAVTGVHTIIHLENAQWWGRQRDLERVELSGTRNLITAARAARVGRLIVLSQIGAAPSSAYTLHRIKGMQEEIIRNSGLAYTIIRPGLVYGPDDAFINNIAMMLRANPIFFLMPGQGEVVLHPLYIDDLIRAMMVCLESIDAIDRIIEIGGVEYATLEEIILTVMRVTRMRRLLIPVPPYLIRWTTWLYGRILPRTLTTPQWLDILATNRTAKLGAMYENFGFQPRRFEDTLVTYLPKRAHLRHLIRNSFRRRPRSV